MSVLSGRSWLILPWPVSMLSSVDVSISLNDQNYTYGDQVEGTVTLTVKRQVEVLYIQVQVQCDLCIQLTQYIQPSLGSMAGGALIGGPQPPVGKTIANNTSLFTAKEVVFPDYPEPSPKSHAIKASTYSFPFSITLPHSSASLPESFQYPNCTSGYFWSADVRVKRPMFVADDKASAAFTFSPVSEKPGPVIYKDRSTKSNTLELKTYLAPPSGLFSKFSKKNHVLVDITTTGSVPLAGVPRSPELAGLGFTIGASKPNLLTIKWLKVLLTEQLVLYSEERGKTYHENIPEVSAELINVNLDQPLDNETDFSSYLEKLTIENVHVSFEDKNFKYTHTIDFYAMVVSVHDKSNYRRVGLRVPCRVV